MITIILSIIVAVFIVCVTALILISIYFYQIAFARNKKDFLWNEDNRPRIDPNDKNWMEQANFEQLEILSDDGLKLKAYYLRLKSQTDKTVILSHGYGLNGTFKANFARFYAEERGYNVLIPDARGHGSSEGDYVGFGWHERKDYKQWINLLISKQGNDAKIILHGVSMGGATVLMTSGEELPSNVKAIVADCAYTSVKDQLSYQLKNRFGLPSFPFIPTVSVVSKIKAGYTLSEASALAQVKHAKIPILFIHGEEDDFVPYQMVYRLYNACSSKKELFTVKGADHANAYNVDRQGYQNAVCSFLDQYM